jgi:uncharacterized Zn-finger protein
LLNNSWLARVILVLWLVSAVFVLFLLGRIDWVVHNELYGYGLQFSLDWAVGYWSVLRSIQLFLAVPIAFSVVYLVLEVWAFVRDRRSVPPVVERKPVAPVKPLKRSFNAVEGQNHMLVSCPKCRRVFGKPLVMLDFSGGKTKLVNVCPYCNHVLSRDGEEAEKGDVRIAGFDEKEVER